MPDANDEFLTVAEIAEVLKLNQQTVRNWIDQGRLPAVRVGRRVRVLRSDFDQLVSQGYGSDAERHSPAGITGEDFWSGEIPLPQLPS